MSAGVFRDQVGMSMEAVTCALDLDNHRVVQQAVEKRSRNGGVTEE